MPIQYKRKGKIILVFLSGDFDYKCVELLKSFVKNEQNKSPIFILNFSKIRYIDREGLSGLVDMSNYVKKENVKLYSAGLDNKIKEIFIHTGIIKIFNLYGSKE